jgi:hypothetical protein
MSRLRRRTRWKPGNQRAPRMLTILISILLVLVGGLLTVFNAPVADALSLARSAADTLELIGEGTLAAAMILMLLGIFIEGL